MAVLVVPYVHTSAVRGIVGDSGDRKRIVDQAVLSLRFTQST
jgi:hypothetical protein